MSLFSRVKTWFQKGEPEYQDSYEAEGAEVLVDDASYQGAEGYAETGAMPDYAAELAPADAAGQAQPSRGSRISHIQVPLAPIVAGLPEELRRRLLLDNVGDASIFISLETILPQLARGQACISFGELREASAGAFATSTDRDEQQVHLPLAVVLPRITPDMLARKRPRQQFDIPEEIVSPFADMGRGLSIANVQRGSVATASALAQSAGPAESPERVEVAPTPAMAAQRSGFIPHAASQHQPPATPAAGASVPRAVVHPKPTLASAPSRLAAPPRPGSPLSAGHPRPPGAPGVPPIASRPASRPGSLPASGPKLPQTAPAAQPGSAAQSNSPAPAVRPAGVPLSNLPRPVTAKPAQPQALHLHAPAANAPRSIPATGLLKPATAAPAREASNKISGASLPNLGAGAPAAAAAAPRPIPGSGLPPHPKAASPAPFPAAAPAEPAAAERPPVLVLMNAISEFWPESIKEEVLSLQAMGSKVGLPFTAVEAGLRKGRLCFSWQQLRSWIRPAVPREASAQDDVQLELPLRTVAPLFIAQQRSRSQSQPRVAVDMSIPDLFNGGEEAVSEQETDHAVSRPLDTNFYVWEDEVNKGEMVQAEQQRLAELTETQFLKRASTPNEVVSRAVALEGVEGAVIALPDGLVISCKVPATINGDTVAAFLPQLYGKVSQCTQELRMGELNNLKFTVGNVPWKVYRVNALYFAAFGKAGKPLPGAPLHALARELDRTAKE
jgi:predicted regulator of Ras-like GTPase activity (Roadblock/LC7/MglB family)